MTGTLAMAVGALWLALPFFMFEWYQATWLAVWAFCTAGALGKINSKLEERRSR